MNDRIYYWLSAPVFHDDEDKTRKAQILHMLQSSMIAALLLATFGAFFVFVNKALSLALVTIMFVFVLISYRLAARGRILAASRLFVSELWVIFSLTILFTGRFNTSSVSLHLAVVVMAGILLGMRSAITFSVLSVLFGLALVGSESVGFPLVRYFPVMPMAGWFTWTLSFILILMPLTPTIQNVSQSAAALREQKRLIESILAATPNIIHIYDLQEQRSIFSSRNIITSLGYAPEEYKLMDNASLKGVFHPEDYAVLSNLYEQWKTASDDKALMAEYRMRTKNNEWRWFMERDVVFRREVGGMAQQLAGTIIDITEHKLLEAELERQATTDPLTGVFNRRQLIHLAEVELERARRYEHPTSAIMLDVDHFKKINDTYGHAAGDKVLVELAKLLTEKARTSDLVTRYGGEEFMLLLPETTITSAQDIAERLRSIVEETSFVVEGQTIRITISLGVAGSESVGQNFESLLKETDHLLYQAKQSGRNRVVSSI
ncbi:MAG: sensor domain-containing diguanylate cyclase [Anaerolineales bacterium]